MTSAQPAELGAGPVVPAYGEDSLLGVLPGVAASLGVDVGATAVAMPPARRACVVLVDGSGRELLEQEAGTAPFLASLSAGGRTLTAGCPSTTATSLGSFGTGLPPGRHGLVGYEVMDPDRGVLLNELRWDPATDPLAWQPHRTVFQALVERGVRVAQIGNPEFAGSGLTSAALRGGEFVGTKRLPARVDAALRLLTEPRPALVYLYWGEVDAAGHLHGHRSSQWLAALRRVDREIARLARRLGPDTLLWSPPTTAWSTSRTPAGWTWPTAPTSRPAWPCSAGRRGSPSCTANPAPRPMSPAGSPAALGDRAWVSTRTEAIAEGLVRPR